jgi:uncharacterized membrane protein
MLFLVGGLLYIFIEIVYRGYSHPFMFVLGGLSLILVGLLNERKKPPSIVFQMIEGGIIITILELITGLLFNMDYEIWDYRNIPLNFKGQICLPFTMVWCLLSFIAIKLDDFLRGELKRK